MPTIKELKAQIEREKAKKRVIQKKFSLELEKSNLQRELKKLQRKPGTLRNIALAKRTGRGLKFIGKKTFKAVKKQAILIKEQQLRDQALARKQEKAFKKRKKKIKKSIKQPKDFFGGLPELGI